MIGRRGAGSTNGAGRYRCIRSERYVILEHAIDALTVHDQQHEIGGLRPNLKADAALAHFHEDGCGPVMALPAAHHTLAELAADTEGGLLHARHHDHAFSLAPQIFRNAPVGRLA